jgi:hypothetical protein
MNMERLLFMTCLYIGGRLEVVRLYIRVIILRLIIKCIKSYLYARRLSYLMKINLKSKNIKVGDRVKILNYDFSEWNIPEYCIGAEGVIKVNYDYMCCVVFNQYNNISLYFPIEAIGKVNLLTRFKLWVCQRIR